jgi:hypothetical protein
MSKKNIHVLSSGLRKWGKNIHVLSSGLGKLMFFSFHLLLSEDNTRIVFHLLKHEDNTWMVFSPFSLLKERRKNHPCVVFMLK